MRTSHNCIIIAAGELGQIKYQQDKNDYVIAADRGYLYAEQLGVIPDCVIGDFDSLGQTPQHDNVIVLPCEKDDTDTSFAVKRALEMGIKQIFILGGLGGNFDHSFANIQLLTYIARAGGCGFLVGQNEVLTVIKNSEICVCGKKGQRVSVFSLTEKSYGVCERGFKYSLEDTELQSAFALGVSNEIKDSKASVSTKSGELLVYFECDTSEFINKNRMVDTDVYTKLNVYL